jgi:hypothetical protein
MTVRFVSIYVRVLFAAEVLLFALSLALHAATVVWDDKRVFTQICPLLFGGTWVIGAAITPFRNRSNWEWVQEIKLCPGWMWKGALGFGAYLFIVFATVLVNGQPPGPETISAFLIAFNAAGTCLIYSAILSTPITPANLAKRARNSIMIATLCGIIFAFIFTGHLRSS